MSSSAPPASIRGRPPQRSPSSSSPDSWYVRTVSTAGQERDYDRPMASYWLEEPADPLPRTTLTAPPEVEIVGGGVTGNACALALAEAGVRVRLHEAREIAGGASGRNGGFALRGGALPYNVARARLGATRARE